jgi:hypothetical protein
MTFRAKIIFAPGKNKRKRQGKGMRSTIIHGNRMKWYSCSCGNQTKYTVKVPSFNPNSEDSIGINTR